MKSMKQISKKILVILAILLVLFPTLFSGISLADDEQNLLTTERAGNYVSTFAINFFNNWSHVGYINKEGISGSRITGNGNFIWPLDPGERTIDEYITPDNDFGEYGTGHWRASAHHGIDFGMYVVEGKTEVYSICDGVVIDADNGTTGHDGGYGRNVKVYNEEYGVGVIYAHLYSVEVKQGDTITAGTMVGYVGNTGNSTGAHLHFEVITDNVDDIPSDMVVQRGSIWGFSFANTYSVNPRYFIKSDGSDITKKSNNSLRVEKRGEIKTAYDSAADEVATPVDAEDEWYTFSNKSWLDFAFKNGLGLEESKYYPTRNFESNREYFEEIGNETLTEEGIIDINELVNSGKILPGDILRSSHSLNGSSEYDYLLYVGGAKVIYAVPPYKDEGALKYEYLTTYFTKVKNNLRKEATQGLSEEEIENAEIELPAYGITKVYRITDRLINSANIYENTGRLFYNGKGYYDPNTTYTGIPKKGAYEGIKKTYIFGIKSIADIFWFLVSLLTYLIRAVIVGWVNIFNVFIQSVVYKLNGTTAQLPLASKMSGIPSTASSESALTIEGLLFNRIPIVDANFMNYESAGGHVLTDENGNHTMLYMLRQSLATCYVIVRSFSIAAMLFMLLYVGIRIAITTSAEKKADYKKMIISWIQGFAIVIFIHLFMYLVFYFNDAIIGIIKQIMQASASKILGASTTEYGIYEAVRTKAYAFDIREGLAGLVFYIVLIYLFLRFFLIYIKRAVAIYILGISGSFMGFKYAYDKASGKKSNSLNIWMKDFSFNVLLQSIHCLIYTIFMTIALSTAIESLGGLIVGIVVLQFMIESDKIFRKIFGINAKGGLFEGVNKPESYFTLLAKGRIITGAVQKTFGFVKNTVTGDNSVGMYFKMAKYADENDDWKDAMKKVELAKYNKIGARAKFLKKWGDSVLAPIGIIKAISDTERQEMYRLLGENSSYEAKKEIYNNIKKEKEAKKKHYTRHIVSAKNLGTGAFRTLASVGLLVDGPVPAIHSVIKGLSTINKEIDRDTARRYKRTNPDGRYLPGDLGALQVKDEIAREKFKKDSEKRQGKQDALKLLTTYEANVNKAIDDLNALKAGKTEAEIQEMLDHLEETFKSTNKSNISAGKVSRAVNTYMYKNSLQTLRNSDFDGVMDELQSILDEKYEGEDLSKVKGRIVLDDTTRDELKVKYGAATLDGLDGKKASALIAESINKPEVIKISTLNSAIDAAEKAKLKEISDNMKNMYSVNQKSVIENKGAADAYSKVLKEFKKKMKEVL